MKVYCANCKKRLHLHGTQCLDIGPDDDMATSVGYGYCKECNTTWRVEREERAQLYPLKTICPRADKQKATNRCGRVKLRAWEANDTKRTTGA